MITFLSSIVILILGYFIYGKFTENMFGMDESRQTPAVRLEDGVDFIKLPPAKIF